jgi:hypothetical protein
VTTGVRSGIGLSYWTEDCNGWLYYKLTKIKQMTEPTMECLLAIMEKFEAKLDAHQERWMPGYKKWRTDEKR